MELRHDDVRAAADRLVDTADAVAAAGSRLRAGLVAPSLGEHYRAEQTRVGVGLESVGVAVEAWAAATSAHATAIREGGVTVALAEDEGAAVLRGLHRDGS